MPAAHVIKAVTILPKTGLWHTANRWGSQYERRLLEPFGLNGYGCCEDLTDKLDLVLAIPNIRRISISPWADVARCAEKIGGDYVFSWKPNPAHLVGAFDEDRIRAYIGKTLDAARGSALELVLKDTHTCEHKPERFTRWTQIAREEIAKRYGEDLAGVRPEAAL